MPEPGSLRPIFKAYDIRGVVPDDLDANAARAIGAAFARFAVSEVSPSRILVGRDMRTTGIELSASVIEGITAEDELIIAGTQKLFDKMPITIKGRDDQPQQGAQ